jgi:signal transduction histidine kinase/CheY-like chemotaxis protein
MSGSLQPASAAVRSVADAEALWPLVRHDLRTQAEVARIIFANVLTGAAVTYPAMVIIAWLYHGTVASGWLYGAIGFIIVVQTLILLNWRHYQISVVEKEADGQWAWSVQQLNVASALSFTIIAGISALAVVIAQSSVNAAPMISSVMVLTYLVGATVADFIHRPAVIGYPIILLGPMGVLHAVSGNPPQWAIAVFFAFYFAGVLSYSSMYSKRLQLSIFQRFELDELAQRLEGERKRAQDAHDAKVRFFNATSHDVRQPLQAMSILIDALRLQGHEQASRDRLTHDLDINMDSLRALFDQVLEASRLQAGNVQLHPHSVNLSDLFNRLQARFALQALNEGVRLEFAPTQAHVWADPLALERMAANLIGNALKHAPSGGCVWVGWRSQRGRLEVRDSGPGIVAEEQSRIFDEFYQVNRGGDHSQGLGLGLAIVKRLTELGGQEVGVRSAAGQGSVFWLRLKAARAMQNLGSAPDHQAATARTDSPRLSDEAKSAARAPLGCLVYVENDATLLRVTSHLLRINGWRVEAFSQPEQALACFASGQACDVMLTDFRMGTTWDGAKLIEAARAMPDRAALPAIVMTGDGAAAETGPMRRLLDSSGRLASDVNKHPIPMTRLLHKPVKTEQLLEVIAQCSASQRGDIRPTN